MTNPFITTQENISQHKQIFLNPYGDLVLCGLCKRVYINDLDAPQEHETNLNVHPFYGNEYISLMARTGRRDLVALEIKKKQEEDAKTMEEMKKQYLEKLKNDDEKTE